jgi:hypothetical protein
MKTMGLILVSGWGMMVLAAWGNAVDGGGEPIAPMQAVFLAADAAPKAVPGTFRLRIQSAGRQDGNIYLDSEKDYRDQRNLCVAVFPEAAKEFRAKYGDDPDKLLVGKSILVRGQAVRVRIDFTYDGEVTGKYYYQTHVDVTSADQIEIQAKH